MDLTADRFAGCILGLATGDALVGRVAELGSLAALVFARHKHMTPVVVAIPQVFRSVQHPYRPIRVRDSQDGIIPCH